MSEENGVLIDWFVDAIEGMPPRYLARWCGRDLYNDPQGDDVWRGAPVDFEAGYVPAPSRDVPETFRKTVHGRRAAAQKRLRAARDVGRAHFKLRPAPASWLDDKPRQRCAGCGWDLSDVPPDKWRADSRCVDCALLTGVEGVLPP